MKDCITFAEPADEAELKRIFTDTGMDLAGDIEEHVILRNGKRMLAGGMFYQMDEGLFHLLVFAVSPKEHRQGIGRKFLQQLSARPWLYCREATEPEGGFYRISTIARGPAVPFYLRNQYQACDAEQLPFPFDQQCESCPGQKECNPVPMLFVSRST